jgi:hypothetical protein
MIKLKLLAVILLTGFAANAQKELMSENPGQQKERPTNGPNLRNYNNYYVGYGLLGVIKNDFKDFEFGKSNEIVFGQRFKRKVSELYSFGTTFEFAIDNFRVNPDSTSSTVPTTKELIRTNSLGLGLFNRFNFGKRGNQIGKYFEFGAYAQWVMNSKHISHTDYEISGKELRSKLINPNFVKRINYGVNASIGFNRFAFTLRYRISDLLDNTSPYQKAPRIAVGLQIGIHK